MDLTAAAVVLLNNGNSTGGTDTACYAYTSGGLANQLCLVVWWPHQLNERLPAMGGALGHDCPAATVAPLFVG